MTENLAPIAVEEPVVAPTPADVAADMRSQLQTVAMLMREINYEYTSKTRLREIAGGLAVSYASMVGRLAQIAESQPAEGVVGNV